MKGKILIVDDDADLRSVLRQILEDMGEVIEASNGPEALALLKREKPLLMLLDVSMPGMGGLAVLEAARQIEPMLPIVMLTGEPDLKIAKDALEGGAASYVTKPFDADVLLAEVSRLTGAEGDDRSTLPWRVRT
jgi:DNA-binding NtrC family response regulator